MKLLLLALGLLSFSLFSMDNDGPSYFHNLKRYYDELSSISKDFGMYTGLIKPTYEYAQFWSWMAIRNGELGTLSKLIKIYPQLVNEVGVRGCTHPALYEAIQYHTFHGSQRVKNAREVIELLICHGAHLELESYSIGSLPLNQAVQSCYEASDMPADERIALVRVLLDCGADVNGINFEGDTALISAIKKTPLPYPNSTWKLIQVLLEYGADKDIADTNGITALQYARQNNHPQLARIEKGFKYNTQKLL